MLDLKAIRSDPERIKQALARRGAAERVDELLALDARRRELLPEVENAQAERKTLSKQIGERKQAGEEDEAERLMATVAGLKETIESGKAELEQVDAKLGELEIPYRVVNVAVGDLGDPAAKKYDCEAWIPSQGRYRELTSCSNTTDYQARRLGARYRPAEGEAPQPVHTLNGTACAVGRTIIALIENRQESDGSFTLPKTLHQFGSPERIGAA
jgi:seryl-tRNA synthetase